MCYCVTSYNLYILEAIVHSTHLKMFNCHPLWLTFATELLAPTVSTLCFFPSTTFVDYNHSHSKSAGLTQSGGGISVFHVVQHLTIDGQHLISFLDSALLSGQTTGKHLVDLAKGRGTHAELYAKCALYICLSIIPNDKNPKTDLDTAVCLCCLLLGLCSPSQTRLQY